MANWSTRQLCLDHNISRWDTANLDRSAAVVDQNGAKANVDDITDAAARTTCNFLIKSVDHAIDCLFNIMNRDSSKDPRYGLLYFDSHYTVGVTAEEYILTWEKILNVWIGAGQDGWKLTVIAIDQMRKTIWDKPVTGSELSTWMSEQ